MLPDTAVDQKNYWVGRYLVNATHRHRPPLMGPGNLVCMSTVHVRLVAKGRNPKLDYELLFCSASEWRIKGTFPLAHTIRHTHKHTHTHTYLFYFVLFLCGVNLTGLSLEMTLACVCIDPEGSFTH